MQPLILLDFDGVLFNSAYEAYQVCEHLGRQQPAHRTEVPFAEFMAFRAQLTDAWQFARLYQPARLLDDITTLHTLQADERDWAFAEQFFSARKVMMQDPEWPKLMSPYNFFYQLRPLLQSHPHAFRILSTRNQESIRRTLDYFEVGALEIFGQEAIRQHGSKIAVARAQGWLDAGRFVVYLDDMHHHLQPFEGKVDLNLHADWGYDVRAADSYTQGQAFELFNGFINIAFK